MADGTWPDVAVTQLKIGMAILAAIAVDSYLKCRGHCLRPEPPEQKIVWSERRLTSFNDWKRKGDELYVDLPLGHAWGNVQPIVAGSVTLDGELWAGVGARYYRHFGKRERGLMELSVIPGVYRQGGGPYLGDRPLLRWTLGFGRELKNGNALTFFVDHRSNGYSGNGPNPGIESIGFNYIVR